MFRQQNIGRSTFAASLGFLFSFPCSAAPEKITVALDWTPNTNHIGLYVAKASGIFAKAGLDVRMIQMKQTSTTQVVGAGKAQFGISFVPDLLNARSRKIPIISVAAIVQENTSCFAWRESAGIKTVKDFEGRRYGGWGSPEEEATLRYLMTKNGADFSKLKIVTTGVSDFLPATAKNADFMWIYMGWDGVRAQLEKVALKTLCLRDVDPVFNHPSPLIITSEKNSKSNPEQIRKFLAAANEGYRMAIANPAAAARLFMKEVPESDVRLVTASAEYLAKEYSKGSSVWGHQNIARFEAYRDWAVGQKILKLEEKPSAFVINSFLPAETKGGLTK
jgi:ABC-type nitrate/sulfonate/bicarbonate transport system substrate-binding protein